MLLRFSSRYRPGIIPALRCICFFAPHLVRQSAARSCSAWCTARRMVSGREMQKGRSLRRAPFFLLISAVKLCGFGGGRLFMSKHLVRLCCQHPCGMSGSGPDRMPRQFPDHQQGPISTPYCEERQIARVARSYGYAVTDEEVRNNPNTKVYLCQIIGNDNRLKGSCAGYAQPRGFPW